MRSLRNRLLLALLPLTFTIWGAVAMTVFLATRHEVEDLIDAQLAQSARVLMYLLEHEVQEHGPLIGSSDGELALREIPVETYKYEQRAAFQVLTVSDHKIILRSHGAPALAMSKRDAGFSDRIIDGLPWNVYTLTDPNLGLQVQVGQTLGPREEVVGGIALRMIVPLLIAIPIITLLIWYGVKHAMRPLRVIARDVKGRQSDNLHPIATASVPAEAEPLINALNALFERLQRTFETERRFTADAAHELRTPLAALKAQAQVALRATDDATRRDALTKVVAGVDRATHLSGQLLTLARIDPEIWVGRERVRLDEVASGILADMAPQALAKHIELGLEGSAEIPGDRGMIGILLRNLVDNAISYTPERGNIEVKIGATASAVTLSVSDSGLGIPPEERERVFERFYRPVRAQPPGSGLGLSIVKRIAELHHAGISLASSPLGGLLVEISFPVG